MSVLIDNRQEKIQVDEKIHSLVERVVEEVLKYEECQEEYEVSISFVDDNEMEELNKEYRDIDSTTDVLSFPLLEFEDNCDMEENDEDYIEEELALGDIVISLEKAESQAKEYGHSLEREIAFLVTHGVLHLLGYDHEDEASEESMFKKQEEILNILDILR